MYKASFPSDNDGYSINWSIPTYHAHIMVHIGPGTPMLLHPPFQIFNFITGLSVCAVCHTEHTIKTDSALPGSGHKFSPYQL